VLLGRWQDADRAAIGHHFRGWLIKAYFFALFWVWLTRSTQNILHFDLSGASWSNLRAYELVYELVFFVDLLLATVGYAMTFRALDTHIRSAEPSVLGWLVALVCYEPFFSGLFERQYLHYGGNSFGSWLAPHPALRWAWAACIVALITVYVLATVAFGVRFSNLTNRGIVTNGPYRFTKHPAYVSKNLSWWLASVPFVASDSAPEAVRRCLLLGVINFIYFMRAKTEERHLSRDPAYVAYATWMNEHGWLRWLNRMPLFRFEPPSPAA
jgi:protein-S-isoprenylcysteine O-methyltransferase Ste14